MTDHAPFGVKPLEFLSGDPQRSGGRNLISTIRDTRKGLFPHRSHGRKDTESLHRVPNGHLTFNSAVPTKLAGGTMGHVTEVHTTHILPANNSELLGGTTVPVSKDHGRTIPPTNTCQEPIGISQKPVLCLDPASGDCPEKGCGLGLCEFHMTLHKVRHETLNQIRQVKSGKLPVLPKKEEFY